MAGKTSRAPLQLRDKESKDLLEKSRSTTLSVREVQRAKILLLYSTRTSLTEIAREVHVSRATVYKCIDKALAMGVEAALKDLYHRPWEPKIGDDAKLWVVHLACTKPKELGYAAEVWSRRSLADHVRKTCQGAGHPCLARAGKATVQRILSERTLHPEKIRYYLERRDPQFEKKMKEVLLVYKKIFTEETEEVDGKKVLTGAVDEKPGVQAIANTAPDLPPVPDTYPTVARDHE